MLPFLRPQSIIAFSIPKYPPSVQVSRSIGQLLRPRIPHSTSVIPSDHLRAIVRCQIRTMMSTPQGKPHPDTIRIANLSLHLPHGIGPSAFNLNPAPPCPANLSLEIRLRNDVLPILAEDDSQASLGVDYSSLSKEIIALTGTSSWERPEVLLREVSEKVLENDTVEGVKLELELSRASLQAQSIIYRSTAHRRSSHAGVVYGCEIRNVRCMTIVGLREYERKSRQWLELDVAAEGYATESWDHINFASTIYDWLEKSSYGTIEALVDDLGFHLLNTTLALRGSPKAVVNITLRKPSALPYAVPGIHIRRTMQDYTKRASSSRITGESAATSALRPHGGIFIALGSNQGDKVSNINQAVAAMPSKGITVIGHSRLYESVPMYHLDQDRFVNAVIEVDTELSPIDLLRQLKRIEKEGGRTKTFRNGPRTVDLDLLLYRNESVQIGEAESREDEDGVGWLECPHPRISEREFVLRPLADLAPDVVHPRQSQSFSHMLDNLMRSEPSSLVPILGLPHPAAPMTLDRTPKIMQIFNATPDSFSDGDVRSMDLTYAMYSLLTMFNSPHPPDILDIGGQSTRPGAIMCTAEEEMSRVVPLVQAIRASDHAGLRAVPISIDTFRPEVARAAVEAGASIVNDVKGGTEPGMLETMAELNVPVILMHSRGDSTTMLAPEAKDYTSVGGVVEGVKLELGQRVQNALKAGVKRWNIIIDPGLGFAKGTEENLALLRHLPDLIAPGSPLAGYPLLVAGSRKRFIGQIIEREEPKERVFGDAAVVGWCLASGLVGIMRVHEGRGMSEMVRMWKAIDESPGAQSNPQT